MPFDRVPDPTSPNPIPFERDFPVPSARARVIRRQRRPQQELIDNLPDFVVRLDSELRYRFVNRRFEQLADCPRRKLIGRPIGAPANRGGGKLARAAELARLRAAITGVFASGLAVEDQFEFWTGDTGRSFRLRIVPERMRRGTARTVLLVGQDVTENVRAEDALRESEGRFARAFHASPVALGIIRLRDERFVEVNERFLELLGFQRNEVLGRTAAELRILESRSEDEQRLRHWAGEFELRTHHRNGETLVLLASTVTIELEGRPHVLAFMLDVSGRKRAEAELERIRGDLARAGRAMMVGALAASIAHEVSQPLVGVAANADAALRWLNRPEPNVDEATAALRRIVRDSHRASEVVTRIRTLLQNRQPAKVNVDLPELLREFAALTEAEARSRKVRREIRVQPGLPPVPADRVQVQQVLLNLALNSFEAMEGVHDRERVLSVGVSRSGDGPIHVRMADTGVGVPVEQAGGIFEPFYTTKERGIGLGLSLSRTIVEAHGGRLWAASTSGPGATFEFTLPPGDSTPA